LEQAAVELKLAQAIAQVMGGGIETISVALLDRRVVISGTAPSYLAKARAEECVRQWGYHEVDNGLRVIPAVEVMDARPVLQSGPLP
jgi:hypothetical protein